MTSRLVPCSGYCCYFPSPAPGLRLPGRERFGWSRPRFLHSFPFPGGGGAGAGPCFSANGDSLAHIHPGADADGCSHSDAYAAACSDRNSLAQVFPGAR